MGPDKEGVESASALHAPGAANAAIAAQAAIARVFFPFTSELRETPPNRSLAPSTVHIVNPLMLWRTGTAPYIPVTIGEEHGPRFVFAQYKKNINNRCADDCPVLYRHFRIMAVQRRRVAAKITREFAGPQAERTCESGPLSPVLSKSCPSFPICSLY